MRTERTGDTDVRFRRNGAGGAALVFVHGFLDDQYVWDGVIAELGSEDVETVQLDLAGMGESTDARGPFTFDRFASEVGAVLDALDKPVMLVGQSMAAPVVELVAATRPELTLGLVLVNPVPLAGTHLPDEVIEPFRSLGGDLQGQRSVRQQLGPGLGEADLDRLAVIGARIRPDVVRALADCWNNGHPDGEKPSRFAGPVLGRDEFGRSHGSPRGRSPRGRRRSGVAERAGGAPRGRWVGKAWAVALLGFATYYFFYVA